MTTHPSSKSNAHGVPDPISFVLLLTLFFLSWLALTSQLIIFHDSIGYRNQAELFISKPWQDYFITGPNREPLYALLISLSMRLAQWLSLDYLSLQVLVQIGILLLSQYLTYRLLKKLHVSEGLCAVLLLYMGISPALVSSGLILFSEVITYPIILCLVMSSAKSWIELKNPLVKKTIFNSLNFSTVSLLMIFTKGAFELIVPLMMLPFLWALVYARKNANQTAARNAFVFILMVSVVVYLPVTAYKLTNQHFNGVYALTDRGPEALYGNTARRMMPLSAERVQTAFAYMAGPDVCSRLFDQRCLHWSFQTSDQLGAEKSHVLIEKGLNRQQISKTLIQESIPFVLKNPLQFGFLSILEGGKIFFWEAPEISFVVYPDVMDNIYNAPWFRYALRCLMAFLSVLVFILGLLSIRRNTDKILTFQNADDEKHVYHLFICLMILMFAIVHSLFFVLPRYALPVAPLFLTLIAWQWETFKGKQKRQ